MPRAACPPVLLVRASDSNGQFLLFRWRGSPFVPIGHHECSPASHGWKSRAPIDQCAVSTTGHRLNRPSATYFHRTTTCNDSRAIILADHIDLCYLCNLWSHNTILSAPLRLGGSSHESTITPRVLGRRPLHHDPNTHSAFPRFPTALRSAKQKNVLAKRTREHTHHGKQLLALQWKADQ